MLTDFIGNWNILVSNYTQFFFLHFHSLKLNTKFIFDTSTLDVQQGEWQYANTNIARQVGHPIYKLNAMIGQTFYAFQKNVFININTFRPLSD